MKINPLVQLEALLECGMVRIERTGAPCEYEVTTYFARDHHAHHGGATLAEAINRATRALPSEGDERL